MAVYHPLAEQAAILRAALDEAWQEPPRESKAFDALMAKNAQLAGLEGRLAALGRLEDVPEAQIEGHDSVYWAGRWSAQRDREAAMRAGIAINCE